MNEKNTEADCQGRRLGSERNWLGIITVLCLLSILGLASSPPEREPESEKKAPMLALEEAAAAARSAAKLKVGGKMNRYVLQEVEFQPKHGRWRAFFEEKEPPYTYDSCFKVFVNDQTKETEFQACP